VVYLNSLEAPQRTRPGVRVPVILECEGLRAGYGDVPVVWDAGFAVAHGELVALVGANGSGKTTTLRALSGVIRPWAGRITFMGERIEGLPPGHLVKRGLAHVPEGRGLFPEMTVRDNLILGAVVTEAASSRLGSPEVPATGGRRRERRREALERVYGLFPILERRSNQTAGTLSGGEQQMLAIGRALTAEPALLMLDEPSLGLAPRIVAQLLCTLGELKTTGTTILLVEQNLTQALALADWAYVLENGRVVSEGAGAELLEREDIRRAYLGL
jgi:branched-chain amino acid transport system ATP-binding protein